MNFEKWYICTKCNVIDKNGEYYDAIGWFCESHYKELCNIINEFIQPERSKREDFDCCSRVKILEKWWLTMDGFDHPDSDFTLVLLNEAKMRCSEHCSNAVREAK